MDPSRISRRFKYLVYLLRLGHRGRYPPQLKAIRDLATDYRTDCPHGDLDGENYTQQVEALLCREANCGRIDGWSHVTFCSRVCRKALPSLPRGRGQTVGHIVERTDRGCFENSPNGQTVCGPWPWGGRCDGLGFCSYGRRGGFQRRYRRPASNQQCNNC